jgi:DNA-binding LacI/PurR family transcriptional regulator
VLAAHPRGVQESSELIGSMQAEHLIGRGYRLLRFAGFLDTRADVFGASRQRGFEQACAAHGIDTLPAWQIELSHRAAHACVSEEHHSPLGVACYNDEVALTLLSAALAKGLRVPDDVGFVGVDRTPLGQAISTPLTTVAYDAREAGRGLARFALSCLGVLDQPSSPDNGFGVSQGATT